MRGLFTIPAGTPFLDALASGLLAEYGGDPAALSAVRLFLPTRRACQAMADAFLRVSGGRPLLLPRLEPLGDIDPEDWHEPASAAAAAADLPPAIGQTRRQLLLAALVLKRGGTTPDQALKLAEALGQWLDQVQIHGLDTEKLAGLVPDEYAAHWGQTLEFLRIVTHFWPSILEEQGVMDPVKRREAIIKRQIAAWEAVPPATPVIAAGSTGSLPATAALMAAILELPQGAVVLPGLDTGLPPEAWGGMLPAGHPQEGLGNLLAALGRDAATVTEFPHGVAQNRHDARRTAGRAALLRAALMPADLSQPLERGHKAGDGLEGLIAIAAPGPEAEARVIALRLREFLAETEPNSRETAALITPDRGLARRVAAELRRWDIDIDDSAGEPLGETPPGAFLRLVAEAAAERLAPVPLLSLLKHPLAGVDRAAVEALERAALRGIRPSPGIHGLQQALKDQALKDKKAPEALALVEHVAQALAPLLGLTDQDPPRAGLGEWLTAHVQAAEALAATADQTGADQTGAERLWAGEAGEMAAATIDGLLAAANSFADVHASDYPAVFEELTAGQTVRPRYGKHPRLAILGPLEARLQCPHLAILGGLAEGSWPPEPARDPWMGRPMRQDFGLPLPEWRIGLAAHDFCQAMAAPQVMLTWPERAAGAPTVPSRWLSRLELAARQVRGLTGKDDPNPLRTNADQWLRWQAQLDDPGKPLPIPLPSPAPPVEARFTDLSVTGVERWVTDPYGHYAARILKLRALDPVDQPADASERGSLLHAVLHRFLRELNGEWPDDALARLEAAGRAVFGEWLSRPNVQAFWWPRFLRMAAWFVEHESARRADIAAIETETKLTADIAAEDETGSAPITLSARMDRLDRRTDGQFTIIDYKSGSLPAASRIGEGWPPQLPLEAAIVAHSRNAEVFSIEAWGVGGGGEGGEAKDLTVSRGKQVISAADAGEAARDGLARLLIQFSDPAMPYLAEPRPSPIAPRYSDYRHLARIDREGGNDE